MKPGRTYFVYRVFDDRGLLLYVGCTADLDRRAKQHRYDRALWLQYKHAVRLEGPFDEVGGFARESEVIESERPYFNALREHRVINVQRTALDRRLHRELRSQRPELFGRASEMSPEFVSECARIERQVDLAIPAADKDWRHRHYLQARIATPMGEAA